MKKKVNLILIFIFVVIAFCGLGIGSYLIQGNPIKIENGNVNNNNDNITITVKYKVYDNLTETETDRIDQGTRNINSDSAYNDFKSYVSSYIDTEAIPYFNNPSNGTTLQDGKYLITKSQEYSGFYFVIQNSSCKVTITSGSCGGSDTTSYSGSCNIYFVKYDRIYEYSLFSDSTYDEIITCNSGYIFNSYYIKSKLHLFTEDDKYSFLYFKYVNSDGTLTDEIVNDGITINSDSTICAIINNNKSTTLGKIDITELVKNTTSTLKVYIGSSQANVSDDYTYASELNSFSLGKNNNQISINSGANINFCLNSGSEYFLADSKNSNNGSIIEAEVSNKSKQYTVCLNSSLVIESGAKLTIGAYLGKSGSTGVQGHINGDYVCLDLMGNNLIVKGELLAYGLIKDSIGTGRVIVEGGELTTPTTILDYKGGTNTRELNTAKVFPFLLYNIPYLRAKTIIKYDELNGKWGGITGFLRICLQTTFGATFENINIRFIGNDNNYFFQFVEALGSFNESYLEFTSYLTNAPKDEITNSTNFNSNALRRISWNFENVKFKINSINLTINSVNINTSDFIFPLSPFMEIFIKNSIYILKFFYLVKKNEFFYILLVKLTYFSRPKRGKTAKSRLK